MGSSRPSAVRSLIGFVARAIVNAAMIYLAAQVVPGIELRGEPLWPALLAGVVLSLVNAVVRPILKVLTLPLTLLTLGLFLFVLNAFCLWLTSVIVPGFDVHGFWPAFLGALLISVVSWALTVFVSDSGRVRRL
ncbi:MAG TPA: phage holin family protein [Candidatus Binatia bacterium]|nr:phage holin family protein [Candidatus Binatia bacterium]